MAGRCLPLIDFSSSAAESLADAPYNSTVLGYTDRLKPLESPPVDLPSGSVVVIAVVVEAVVVVVVVVLATKYLTRPEVFIRPSSSSTETQLRFPAEP